MVQFLASVGAPDAAGLVGMHTGVGHAPKVALSASLLRATASGAGAAASPSSPHPG